MDVHAGTSVGIVGESGSGKTTFGRVLVGLLDPSSGRGAGGRALVEARSSRTDPQRRNVQMIFQDPYGSLNGGMSGWTRSPRCSSTGRASAGARRATGQREL